MKISERATGTVAILDVEGRMTAEFSERQLAGTVRRLLQEGRRNLLLNLERVPQIDTTGLTEIMEAYTATRRQGGHLKLEHVTRNVHEILRVTQLLRVLETFDVEAEALASFGAAPA